MVRCRCAFVSDSVVVSVGVGVWSLTKDSFASKIKIRVSVQDLMTMMRLALKNLGESGLGELVELVNG